MEETHEICFYKNKVLSFKELATQHTFRLAIIRQPKFLQESMCVAEDRALLSPRTAWSPGRGGVEPRTVTYPEHFTSNIKMIQILVTCTHRLNFFDGFNIRWSFQIYESVPQQCCLHVDYRYFACSIGILLSYSLSKLHSKSVRWRGKNSILGVSVGRNASGDSGRDFSALWHCSVQTEGDAFPLRGTSFPSGSSVQAMALKSSACSHAPHGESKSRINPGEERPKVGGSDKGIDPLVFQQQPFVTFLPW